MNRRKPITFLGGGAASSPLWPLTAGAQPATRRPLIAYLAAATRERTLVEIAAFLRGLRELDYVEGRNFDIAYRFAEGHVDRSAALAEELLQLKPNVIFAVVAAAAVAARALTQTVPIV